jgi:hypothetical protein
MKSGTMTSDLEAEIKRKRPYTSEEDFFGRLSYMAEHRDSLGFEEYGPFSFYPYDDTIEYYGSQKKMKTSHVSKKETPPSNPRGRLKKNPPPTTKTSMKTILNIKWESNPNS